jgi:hypothetical protein
MHRVGSLALALWLASSGANADPSVQKPKLFLSCPRECFDPYLRQQLSYFDFARDPHLADYTLVVARVRAGNGGEQFTVTLGRPLRADEPVLPARSFTMVAGAPAHDARHKLLQAILQLLHAELAATPHEAAFELSVPARDGAALSALDDPWSYLVIAPELGGGGEGGSGYYFADVFAALTLRRTTAESKLRLNGAYSRALSSYLLEDGSRVSGDVFKAEARAMYAHSIGEHWALGGVAAYLSAEFNCAIRSTCAGGP